MTEKADERTLSAERLRLIAKLRERREDSITPVARREDGPVSFAQQRLWFLDQLFPGLANYTMAYAVRLRGPVDLSALNHAFTAVMERHEVLRSVYPAVDGEPRQVIRSADPVELPVVDVSAEADPPRRAEQTAQEWLARPFDLAAGPLVRPLLVRLADEDHVLLVGTHHIVSDDQSQSTFASDLWDHYNARVSGERPPTREPRVQYADFVAWQRRRLTGDALETQSAYWRERLAGLPDVLELPGARPRTATPDPVGAVVDFEIDAATTAALRELSRRHGATLFMTVLAAFQLVLGRLAHRTDVAVGVPITGRVRPELEGMVGFFVNTLVMRADCSGNPTFGTLLEQVRGTALDAYAHQELPFEQVVDLVSANRDLSRNPLVQVMFQLSQGAKPGVGPRGLVIERFSMTTDTTRFDVECALVEREEVISGQLVYNVGVYPAAVVERLATAYRQVLSAVAEDAERRVWQIDLLEPGTRSAVLDDGNAATGVVPDTDLTAVFESHVAATPDAIAVMSGDVALSYAELDRSASRLADRLAACGLPPEAPVAILMERSVDLVVAVLAVVKAGAAYVPLRPEDPPSRVRALLTDVGCVAMLSTTGTASREEVADGLVPHTLLVDEEGAAPRPPHEPVARDIHPDRLACVMFTSGSTGEPKGIGITHRAIVNLAHDEDIAVTPGDRVLFHAPHAFDASTYEVWTPLLCGATVVVAPPADVDAVTLGAVVREAEVTVVHLTAGLLRVLAGADLGALAGVRRLLTGGDVVSPAAVRLVREQYPDLAVRAMYGPTETTTFATSWMLDRTAPIKETIPVGRPMANKRVYVLDGGSGLVGPGVVGELFVGGVGVARGYLGRAGLTASRFVPDPFGGPGERMYRTGDLVRWRDDGVLEFVGRVDDQVKVRGFRVEPAEVEGVLAECRGVRQAVVVASGDPGDRRLVAYVVLAGGVDVGVVRGFVESRLPEYMVPSVFVELAELPLTNNGKVDRRALPEPEIAVVPGRLPRGPREEVLCGLFAEVLGVPRVGVDDGFFELGGHSLLAARLVARVRSVLGVEVGVRALFEAPTVTRFAQALPDAPAARPALRPLSRPERIPLSFAQQRLWFLDQLEEHRANHNIAFGLRLTGPLDHDALTAALNDVVARHESLRTVFRVDSGVPHQHILDPRAARLPLEVTETDEAELTERLTRSAHHEFDLAAGLPIHAELFELHPLSHVLLLVLHHIAGDAGSTKPLARDLSDAYAARLAGRAPEWQPLPVQYADYTLWQRELLGYEHDDASPLAAQVRYWTDALSGLPAHIELPTDRPRPAIARFRGDAVGVKLGAAPHGALTELARSSNVTMFMVLHAALVVLLRRLGAGADFAVGAPVAGRSDEATDDLVGFFVNTLALRVDASGDPTFRELLARVRKTDLDGYANQDVPFERLVELLNPARSLSYHPLFQVMLGLTESSRRDFAFTGLSVDPVSIGSRTSRFDLVFLLTEHQTDAREPAGMNLVIEYDTDLFDRRTIEEMSEQFLRLLESVVSQPDQRVGDIDLLGDARRRQLLAWGHGHQTAAQASSVPEMFEQQVRRSPDADAVADEHATLSYRELDRRSNRLAHHLIGRGVGPEDLVAVAMRRGNDLAVALLAVLKSGAAYLPLDLDYPAERLAVILADAPVKVVLTHTAVPLDVPGRTARVYLDDLGIAGAGETTSPRDEDRVSPITADTAAYVIYTSGSTGAPKGVVMPTRGFANMLSWHRRAMPGGVGTRTGQLTAIGFDFSVQEMLAPLVMGGALVFPPNALRQDLDALARWIDERGVNEVYGPTSVIEALLEAAASQGIALDSVTDVLQGGEAFTLGERIRSFFGARPQRRAHNVYGPAETHVVSTSTLSGDVDAWPASAPIGEVADNVRAYVLDSGLALVGVGVVGELFVGGAGVARGYLGRAGLTAARFVPDPFGGPGERMYRVGDLVRWRAGGVLEFVGRVDDQVKVRGFRVEPGEVEAVLARCPGVLQAVVVASGDPGGSRRLVAYVVPADSVGGVDVGVVRGFAESRLPEYMVPASFTVLEELPLTRNGKVDRRALPEPVAAAGSGRLPRGPREEVLCGLFAEVLGVSRVGVDDGFFELGGHSLLAARLVGRVRSVLNVNMSVRVLFEAPTVARLAERLEESDGTDALEPLLPLRKTGGMAPLFLVHPVLGTSWCYSALAASVDSDVPLYGLQEPSLRSSAGLPDDIPAMAADYVARIRGVQPSGPYRLLGWSFGGLVAHEIAVQLRGAGEEVSLLAMLDSYPAGATAPVSVDIEWPALAARYGADPGDAFDPARFVAAMFNADSVLDGLDEEAATAVLRVCHNNLRLFFGFTPGRFDGDVLIFRATEERDVEQTAEKWSPYVGGDVEEYDIAVRHEEMTTPEALREIGRVLTERFREIG